MLSFDPIDALSAIGYKLPYVDRDFNEIGGTAMRLLLNKLKKGGPESGTAGRVILPCSLVTG